MKTNLTLQKGLTGIAFLLLLNACKHETLKNKEAHLTLEPGFSAVIVADSLGHARHLAVSKTGDLYVKLAALEEGKGIIHLSDDDGDGVYEKKEAFGNYPGTGILINNDYLYASSNSAVYRYKLNEKQQIVDTLRPEVVVKDLVDRKIDGGKPLALDDQHNLYVAVASYSDACANETVDGKSCPLLDSVGGIWKFKADKLDQSYGDATRFATGLKGVLAMAWNNTTHSLFAAQHGRGAFHVKYPQYFDAAYSSKFPAETLYELKEGADAGWPYIYYDQEHKKKLQAPEFGGDGKKEGDPKYLDPIVSFPAHLGPNGMLFYTGDMFPEKYKNGAFIAFHNQSQVEHKGFFVAFVPFKDGKPSGDWEIFANDFAGIDLTKPSGPSQHKPCGLAQGPDGALYVSDDFQGTIYRISYHKKG